MSAKHEQLFGQIGLRKRLFTAAQLDEALREQKTQRAQGGSDDPIGELLVRRGALADPQIKEVLHEQAFLRVLEDGQTFGAIAVQSGELSEGLVAEALKAMKTHFQERTEIKRLDDVLVERGALTPRALAKIHAAVESGAYLGTTETLRLTRTLQHLTRTGVHAALPPIAGPTPGSHPALAAVGTPAAPAAEARREAPAVAVQLAEAPPRRGLNPAVVLLTAALLLAVGLAGFLYSAKERALDDQRRDLKAQADRDLADLEAEKRKIDGERAAALVRLAALERRAQDFDAEAGRLRDRAQQQQRQGAAKDAELAALKKENADLRRQATTAPGPTTPPAVTTSETPVRAAAVRISVGYAEPPDSTHPAEELRRVVRVRNARYEADTDLLVFSAQFDAEHFEGGTVPSVEIRAYIGELEAAQTSWSAWHPEGEAIDAEVRMNVLGIGVTKILLTVKD